MFSDVVRGITSVTNFAVHPIYLTFIDLGNSRDTAYTIVLFVSHLRSHYAENLSRATSYDDVLTLFSQILASDRDDKGNLVNN